ERRARLDPSLAGGSGCTDDCGTQAIAFLRICRRGVCAISRPSQPGLDGSRFPALPAAGASLPGMSPAETLPGGVGGSAGILAPKIPRAKEFADGIVDGRLSDHARESRVASVSLPGGPVVRIMGIPGRDGAGARRDS